MRKLQSVLWTAAVFAVVGSFALPVDAQQRLRNKKKADEEEEITEAENPKEEYAAAAAAESGDREGERPWKPRLPKPGKTRGGYGVRHARGEFQLVETDLVLPGRGFDFQWVRTYRSNAPDWLETTQGIGWDHSYNLFVEAAGQDLLLHEGLGRADLLAARPNGNYTRRGDFHYCRKNLDDSFTLYRPHGEKWFFKALDGAVDEGRIEAIADRAGNTISFAYDGMGRLQTITDTVGRSISVAYTPRGRVRSVAALGNVWQYAYYSPADPDGSPGDLKSARTPIVSGTPNGNNFLAGKTAVYTYSKNHADRRLNHNLLSITSPSGETWLENDYSTAVQRSALTFDRIVAQRLGAAGDEIQFVYCDYNVTAGMSTPVAELSADTIVNDRRGVVTHYLFDVRNRLIRERRYTGFADPAQPTTQKTNRPAAPLRTTDPAIYETTYAYDTDDLLVRIEHPEGDVERFVYASSSPGSVGTNARCNLLSWERTPGTRGADQSVLTHMWEYSPAFQYVTRDVDPFGLVTEHDYDADGNRIQTRLSEAGLAHDWTHNASGQALTHTWPDDGNGNRRLDAFTYHGAGPQMGQLATSVRDATGGGLNLTRSYTWTGSGALRHLDDERSNRWTSVRNQLGQVVRTLKPMVSSQGGVRYQSDRYFDADDDLVRVDVQSLDEDGLPDANPVLVTSYAYDTLHNQTRSTREVDAATDAVTEFVYDRSESLELVRSDRAVSGTDPDSVVHATYDERDLLYRVTRAPASADASTTEYDYDNNGNLAERRTGVEDGMRTTTAAYDGYDRLTSLADPMGNERRASYDASSRLTQVELWIEAKDVLGDAGNGQVSQTTYAYDGLDRVVSVNRNHDDDLGAPIGGGVSERALTYAGLWGTATATNPNMHTETRTYDRVGRLDVSTDAKGNTVDFVYDATNNVVARVEMQQRDTGGPPLMYAWTALYDELGRLYTSIYPGGDTTTSAYDSRDNARITSDRLGNTTRYAYDGLDRTIQTAQDLTDTGNGAGLWIGERLSTYGWALDENGTSLLIDATDDNGFQTLYEYDPLNRLVRIDAPDLTTHTFTFDAHDDPILETDANATVTTRSFDANGRLATTLITPGPGVSIDTTIESFLYDGRSLLACGTDDDTSITYAYDSLGNALSETLTVQALGGSLVTTSSYARDGAGNVTALTRPDSIVTDYVYDDLERVSTVTVGMTVLATNDYVGPRGRVERSTYANGTVTDWSFDAHRRPTRAVTMKGMTTLFDRTSSWTSTGVSSARANALNGGTSFAFATDSLGRLTESTETPSMGAPSVITYALDDEGNRTTVTGGPNLGAYTLDALLPSPGDAQVNQYTSTPFDTRTYDATGNLATRDPLGPAPADNFDYDAYGRLVQYTDGVTGRVTQYAYDPIGRRVREVRDALGAPSETLHHYAGTREVEERDGTGTTQAVNVLSGAGLAGVPRSSIGSSGLDGIREDPGRANFGGTPFAGFDLTGGRDGTSFGGTPWAGFDLAPSALSIDTEIVEMSLRSASFLATVRGGASLTYHYSPAGNVVGLSDSLGMLAESYEYGDFGDVRTFDENGSPLVQTGVDNPFQFAGMRHDPESGVFHTGPIVTTTLGAGYYEPAVGRFTTRDWSGITIVRAEWDGRRPSLPWVDPAPGAIQGVDTRLSTGLRSNAFLRHESLIPSQPTGSYIALH